MTHHHTEVDVEAVIADVAATSSYPDVHAWAEYFVRSTASDADALRVFGPRDGR